MKTAFLGWIRQISVPVVAVAAALVLVATPVAFAANGKPFILGKRNVASAVTTLVKQGPGPALKLLVRPGQLPMTVNSKDKVANFNADMAKHEKKGANDER